MSLININKYNLLLGSASPRRKQLLEKLGIPFKIIITTKKESFPKELENKDVAAFLAKQKASNLLNRLKANDLLVTADTIVVLNNSLLEKPKNNSEAFQMLSKLSNNSHKVITGVCLKTVNKEIIFSTVTEVTFKKLSDKEINYYIKEHEPLDKAGGYGIQDWIGIIGITNIKGSYSNVIGLPLSNLYQKLEKFK